MLHSEAALLRVILALASLAIECDTPRAPGRVPMHKEIARRTPHASDRSLRLDIWRQQVMSNNTGLNENLVRQLFRWVDVLPEGRVELHHKLAVPLG